VVIVQHMPPTFTASLAARLNQMSNIEVREAKTGDRLMPNVALVAPGGFHMEFDEHQRVTLSSDPPLHGVRPAIDVTIASLCKHFGKGLSAVLLTGMGRDGARGLKTIRDLGGHTVAEHESTCVIYGMPRAAVELGGADCVLPLGEIAAHISKHLHNSPISGRHAA
jgi:two-component system chemotaxis response regulator CheB